MGQASIIITENSGIAVDRDCAQSPPATIFSYDDGSDYFTSHAGSPLVGDPEALQEKHPKSRDGRRQAWWKFWRMELRARRKAGGGIMVGDGFLNRNNLNSLRKRTWYNYCIFGGISGLSILFVVTSPLRGLMLTIPRAFLLAMNLGLVIATAIYKDRPDPALANWGATGTGTEGLTWYPTDFTKDILPIPCHSHNDYWRQVPLFSALRAGCTGVEADVWLYKDDLFVGHNRASLAQNRTLQSLYVNPLVRILEQQNPHTEYSNETMNGVFDEDPTRTLVLLIDVKTTGRETWPEVVKQLEPLRERGWLSYVENGNLVQRPVTVVGTGNTPFDMVTANTTYRDTFFDAPLELMWEPLTVPAAAASSNDSPSDDINEPSLPNPSTPALDAGQGMTGITASSTFDFTNSYYASVSFQKSVGRLWRGRITHWQLKIIRGQLRGAHRRGLKVRYWDLPSWPISLRNQVWDVLVREGVDMLNVDDLKAASHMEW